MHVLALFHAYPPRHNAGAEWMAHAMFRHLAEQGHRVTVWAPIGGDPWELDGVQVVTTGPVDALLPADVLVTHLGLTDQASDLAVATGLPLVHLIHNTFEPTKRYAARPDTSLLVFNTHWARADFKAWMAPMPLPPSIVVHPPVHASDYATTPGDRVTLVNMWDNKGGWLFWKIAWAMPETKFLGVIGGYGTQVIPPVPSPNVAVVENTPRMRDEVYAHTRIVLMPSLYESYGRVAVEAMCSGIPVIAHPTPGLQEAIGDAGVFVDRNDLRGWVDAIRDLQDPDRWDEMSKRAKRRAKQLDPARELEMFTQAMLNLAHHFPRRKKDR